MTDADRRRLADHAARIVALEAALRATAEDLRLIAAAVTAMPAVRSAALQRLIALERLLGER
jgi:hypothetical protein